jgi:hypothetical protein
MKRILLIAPRTEPELPFVPHEVRQVNNTPGLNVTLLHDKVTEQDIFKELRDGSFDMIWFAGRGTHDGILMGGGDGCLAGVCGKVSTDVRSRK